jgi:hypothetical protein
MDCLCTPALTKFHKIHSDIIALRRRLKRRLVEGPEGYVEYPRETELDLRVVRKKEVKYWEIPIKLLEAVDRLWTWFEKNPRHPFSCLFESSAIAYAGYCGPRNRVELTVKKLD